MFGLSTLCLPLSPTWARADDDPERTRERSIVVIQGKGDEDAGERSKSRNLMYVVTRDQDERDDEDSDKSKSKKETSDEKRSIEEIRAAIMQKLEAELRQNVRSKEAAERAMREMKEALSKLSSKEKGMELLLQKKLRDRKNWQDGQASPERKKEIAEAMARVEKARAQLHAAEADLAKLRGGPFMTARLVPPRPPVPPKPFVTKGGLEFRPVTVGPHASDRRIDELERKLDKLVDEIKSLREERDRAK
jgi:hypothetical protein